MSALQYASRCWAGVPEGANGGKSPERSWNAGCDGLGIERCPESRVESDIEIELGLVDMSNELGLFFARSA